MKTTRPGITALCCIFLVAAPSSSFAWAGPNSTAESQENHNKTSSGSQNSKASSSQPAGPSPKDSGFPLSPKHGGMRGDGFDLSSQVGLSLITGDANFAEDSENIRGPAPEDCVCLLPNPFSSFGQSDDGATGGTQESKKPSTGATEPSLNDLGFPVSVTHGSAQYQAMLDRRSHMLKIHQELGLATAIPMFVSLITGPGAKGHHGLPGSPSGRNLHAGLGALTAGMYITTAYFAIRAPRVPGTKTYGPIRFHKAMAWIHGPGMILTPILGAMAYSQLSNGQRVHGIAKEHSIVAGVTFASYIAAMLSVSIKF